MENVVFVYKEGVTRWKGLESALHGVQKNFQPVSLVLNFGNYAVPRVVPGHEELLRRFAFFWKFQLIENSLRAGTMSVFFMVGP